MQSQYTNRGENMSVLWHCRGNYQHICRQLGKSVMSARTRFTGCIEWRKCYWAEYLGMLVIRIRIRFLFPVTQQCWRLRLLLHVPYYLKCILWLGVDVMLLVGQHKYYNKMFMWLRRRVCERKEKGAGGGGGGQSGQCTWLCLLFQGEHMDYIIVNKLVFQNLSTSKHYAGWETNVVQFNYSMARDWRIGNTALYLTLL